MWSGLRRESSASSSYSLGRKSKKPIGDFTTLSLTNFVRHRRDFGNSRPPTAVVEFEPRNKKAAKPPPLLLASKQAKKDINFNPFIKPIKKQIVAEKVEKVEKPKQVQKMKRQNSSVDLTRKCIESINFPFSTFRENTLGGRNCLLLPIFSTMNSNRNFNDFVTVSRNAFRLSERKINVQRQTLVEADVLVPAAVGGDVAPGDSTSKADDLIPTVSAVPQVTFNMAKENIIHVSSAIKSTGFIRSMARKTLRASFKPFQLPSASQPGEESPEASPSKEVDLSLQGQEEFSKKKSKFGEGEEEERVHSGHSTLTPSQSLPNDYEENLVIAEEEEQQLPDNVEQCPYREIGDYPGSLLQHVVAGGDFSQEYQSEWMRMIASLCESKNLWSEEVEYIKLVKSKFRCNDQVSPKVTEEEDPVFQCARSIYQNCVVDLGCDHLINF